MPVKKDSTPMGDIYFDNNAVATVITTQSAFTRVAIASTLSMDVLFDMPANGRLRYIGSATKNFHCGCTMSMKSAGANDQIKVFVYKNGTVNASSEFTGGTQLVASPAQHKTGAVGDEISTAIHVMVELKQNDYLEVGIANLTDTDDITLISMNLFAMASY